MSEWEMPKWLPSFVGLFGGLGWLAAAAILPDGNGFGRTLVEALSFFGGVLGIGTFGGVSIYKAKARYANGSATGISLPGGDE